MDINFFRAGNTLTNHNILPKSLAYPTLVNSVIIEINFLSILNPTELASTLERISNRVILLGKPNFIPRIELRSWIRVLDEDIVITNSDLFLDHKIKDEVLWRHKLVSPYLLHDSHIESVDDILKGLNSIITKNIPIGIFNSTTSIVLSIDTTLYENNIKAFTILKSLESELNIITRTHIRSNSELLIKRSSNTIIINNIPSTKSYWEIKNLIYFLDQSINNIISNVTDSNVQDLYQLVNYPILWHYLTCQKLKSYGK